MITGGGRMWSAAQPDSEQAQALTVLQGRLSYHSPRRGMAMAKSGVKSLIFLIAVSVMAWVTGMAIHSGF
jgi:hypothetical protein